jgi:hypothetical protein
MERKLILLLAINAINYRQEEDNPFCSSETSNVLENMLDFAEALALEQAFHGKTAQELEPIISLFLPNAEQKQLKRQLLEILGGHQADLLTDPLSSPKKFRACRQQTSKRAFANGSSNETIKLRRLSEVAIKRIQHHRVVDVSDVQLQPRRRSLELFNSQTSPYTSLSQPPLTSPTNNLVLNSNINTSGGKSVFGVKNYKRNNKNIL